jgi:histone acetyltransferase (RNA polymerase elongator complex component)
MKKHAIIPLFIPHMGCPHDCVFCNQNTITASDSHMNGAKVREVMESRLLDLEPLGLETIEAAFYGGSFTGLPLEIQREFLQTVLPYKQSGRIQKIRLSTRPDYINTEILELLQTYTVDIIELGVQSFDNQVLSLSNRGHTVEQTIDACRLIKEAGFSLGIQLMIGLPGDSIKIAFQSALKTVEIHPNFVRIYPTVILEGSQLADMFNCGTYSSLSTEEAVDIAKEMVRLFDQHKIPVIRLGLKSTDNISATTDLAGAYHPAFRQLVEGALAFDEMEAQLRFIGIQAGSVVLSAHPKSFSNLIGHKGINKQRFSEEYPQIHFVYKPDSSLLEKQYIIKRP